MEGALIGRVRFDVREVALAVLGLVGAAALVVVRVRDPGSEAADSPRRAGRAAPPGMQGEGFEPS